MQRRVIYPCNAVNREGCLSRMQVFANCRRCELSLSCPDKIDIICLNVYVHVTRLSHAGCSFCNLIGLPEIKTADSAQPRNRSDPSPVWVGSGYETTGTEASIAQRMESQTSASGY